MTADEPQNPHEGATPDQEASSVDLAVGVGKALRPWLIGLVFVAGIIAVLLYGANRPSDPSFPSARANPGGHTYEEREIQVGEKCLLVQVADTPEKRAQGLKDRDTVDPYDGMVFVYEQASQSKFTMAGVRIPLTIAFYDGSGALVDSKDMEPCPDGRDCPLYESNGPFFNAIEVPKGELPAGSYTGDCPA